MLHDEITTIDHALTRPWIITKNYLREKAADDLVLQRMRREQPPRVGWQESYFVSSDGYLMPTKKGQKAPDLRYFKDAK